METNPAYVVRLLCQYRAWERQFTLYSRVVHANHQVLHSCYHSFNMAGFLAAFFGCVVTSTKTILAESLLHGYNFDSINTVYYMAPYATMILALPALLIEGPGVAIWFAEREFIFGPLFIILLSGVSAFCLNFSIFYVIHATTAVTFNVAGNMKVAVAIVISWIIFQNPISFMNAIGCSVTLIGCTFYGYVRHKLTQQASMKASADSLESMQQLLPIVNEEKADRL